MSASSPPVMEASPLSARWLKHAASRSGDADVHGVDRRGLDTGQLSHSGGEARHSAAFENCAFVEGVGWNLPAPSTAIGRSGAVAVSLDRDFCEFSLEWRVPEGMACRVKTSFGREAAYIIAVDIGGYVGICSCPWKQMRDTSTGA
jgi:hypothetical protein